MSILGPIVSDFELSELIEKCRHYVMSPEEIEEQRQSWVRGEMAIGTDADEAAYRGCKLIIGKS
jgi:hypothetical protein